MLEGTTDHLFAGSVPGVPLGVAFAVGGNVELTLDSMPLLQAAAPQAIDGSVVGDAEQPGQ